MNERITDEPVQPHNTLSTSDKPAALAPNAARKADASVMISLSQNVMVSLVLSFMVKLLNDETWAKLLWLVDLCKRLRGKKKSPDFWGGLFFCADTLGEGFFLRSPTNEVHRHKHGRGTRPPMYCIVFLVIGSDWFVLVRVGSDWFQMCGGGVVVVCLFGWWWWCDCPTEPRGTHPQAREGYPTTNLLH